MRNLSSKHLFEENREIVEHLKGFRLFSHLPEELLEQLVPLSELVHYSKGTTILTEGKMNDKVFFLLRGTLSVYVKGELIIELQRKGDIIGEMSVISTNPCTATVIAASRVHLFSIRAKDIGEYTEINTDNLQNTLYRIFANILTEKLAYTNHKAEKYEATNHLLEQANEELKETQSQLIQSAKLASIGELSSGIAHELNQPLMYIRTNAQLELRRGMENFNPQTAYETLKMIEEGTGRMLKIINHLKDFSRQSDLQFEPVDLHDILKNSLIMIDEQLKLHNVQVEVVSAPDLPLVLGDRQQLEQVFINMLTNARDALAEKNDPILTIRLEIHQQVDGICEVITRFTDNGSGIPQAVLDKIFDPFFTTKGVGAGTGLGLSISYGIIHAHQGRLQVSSIEKESTTFEIILPALAEEKKT